MTKTPAADKFEFRLVNESRRPLIALYYNNQWRYAEQSVSLLFIDGHLFRQGPPDVVNEYIKRYRSKWEVFGRVDWEVLSFGAAGINDARLAHMSRLVNEPGYLGRWKMEREQEAVINSGNGMRAYHFAMDNPDADIKTLERIVLAEHHHGPLFHFAKDVPGADIQAIQKAVIEFGDAFDAARFAVKIPGADVAALQRVVLDSVDGSAAYYFAKKVKGADIKALEQVVLRSGDSFDVCHFALEVPGADKFSARARLVELAGIEENNDGNYLVMFDNGANLTMPDGRSSSGDSPNRQPE